MALFQHLLIIASLIVFCIADSEDSDDNEPCSFVSRIAVASRGSGEGLLIESENEDSQLKLLLPSNAEPMYISASILTNEIYIGDRNNKQLLVYDTTFLNQKAAIPACNGIFHQFYNFNNQLWVVCDIDNTLLVIDTVKKSIIKTIAIANIPSGYKPHDLTTSKDYAYVTLLGPATDGANGYIIQYSTRTFREKNRITVGGDPHVWVDCCAITDKDYLFVAAQAVSTVYKLDVETLRVIETADVNGAHGLWATKDYLYVGDITASDGFEALWVINQQDFTDIRKYDAKIGSVHNLIVNSEQDKLFVTHSGPGYVTAYDINADGSLDEANGRIIFDEAGSVPFGIMNIVSFNEYRANNDDDDDSDDRR